MFSTLLALSTIALQIGIIIVILGWILKARFVYQVSKHAGIILAVVFSGAAIGSFIYQYGFGYEPCLLCWYQRIAIIPTAILAWTTNIRKNTLLQRQVLILSILGLAVALFHIYIDISPTAADVCGAGPSCLVRYVYEFGYITIPVMSATTLAAGVLLALLAKRYPQNDVVTLIK